MKNHVSDERRRKIVEFIAYWTGKTALTAKWMAKKIELPYGKFLRWRKRAKSQAADPGQAPKPKAIPKSHWLLPAEIEAIVGYCQENRGHAIALSRIDPPVLS